MQEIGVCRIGNVFGLDGGIYRHPSGLHQSHIRSGLEQQSLNLLYSLCSDPVPELHQGRGFQCLASLKGIESAETLPASRHFYETSPQPVRLNSNTGD